MATLSNGETLEVGGMAGRDFNEIYVRAFEIDGEDTVMEATHLAFWNGSIWRLIYTFDIEIVDLAYVEGTGLYCLGTHGELYIFNNNTLSTVNTGISPRVRVSTLRITKSGIYALGPADRLFKFDASSNWSQIAIEENGATILGLADISATEMIVCGTEAFVAIGSPANLVRTDFPTNVDFNDVLVDRGSIYLCGQSATMFVRRGDEWVELEVESRDADFLNLCVYESKVLVAAETEILKVGAEVVSLFAEEESQKITVIGDCLFSDGMENIMVLRGGEWSEFPVSFTVPDIGTATARPL
jgi:hypothetical protein